MANIPGISGYIQPGAFARDRVVSKGVSLPGGLRILTIMGEGKKEQTLVESAQGSGLDGVASVSPSGNPDGRYFLIQEAPLVSGRTEVRLNGVLLQGVEAKIDSSSFSSKYDYRVDPETGHLELQGSSIGDQGGKRYSASTSNIGNGSVASGECGEYNLLDVLDSNAPTERWTARCSSVVRDGSGNPIVGQSTFTLTGSVSGQLKTSTGSLYRFTDTYKTGSAGAVSGNKVPSEDGLVVASSALFADGEAVVLSGDVTTDSTNTFVIPGDLITFGQALVGDYLCIDGYIEDEIIDISYDSNTDKTTVTTLNDVLSPDHDGEGTATYSWEIRATDVFVDDPNEAHTVDTDGTALVTGGSFSGKDIGKILAICSGTNVTGLYKVVSVTSPRRLRVVSYDDESVVFPTGVGSSGIMESSLTYSLLETNGVLMLGINPGTTPFEVGDKFYIDVRSKALKKSDKLEASLISEADLNDPEFFTSADRLYRKHGLPSETNTLSLGAQMAFENGAPGILAVQCKPSVPRKVTQTLIEEKTARGLGGFNACGGNYEDCDLDDLMINIPRPNGLRLGRPKVGTSVSVTVIRGGKEIQIFPNKVEFYDSLFDSKVGMERFIRSSDYSYSYTIVNTLQDDLGSGTFGGITLESSEGYFSTFEYDFDESDLLNGSKIRIVSLEKADGTLVTKATDISDYLFGDDTLEPELKIAPSGIVSDSVVKVVHYTTNAAPIAEASDIQFVISDISNTTDLDAALLLNRDLIKSGTIKEGDGLRITYIDEVDYDFYDTNWFEAFEKLEAFDTQIVVPLPTQTKSSIFRQAVSHCEIMSSVANKKERMALIGAMAGVTAAALIGNEQVAVEDIGVIEGIQGDDPEEVLNENIEDLQNFKLDENFTSSRAVYFFPDQIVRNIAGTNTFLDGFFVSAAAGGWLSATQNVALPLTNKSLTGFTILRDKIFPPVILNSLGEVGATVLQPIVGGGAVLAGRTTSQSGFVEDEEISIMFIRDRVKEVLRSVVKGFIGKVQGDATYALMGAKVRSALSGMISEGIITDFTGLKVEQDKVDPRQINVFVRFAPAFPINYIFIDIEVGVL